MEENEKNYLDWKGLQEYHRNLKGILSDVAFSGNYKDLNNTPTKVSQFINDAGYVTSEIDNTNGHDYVEIGGIKWATMNIGAESITDIGLYFQWGDIQGYNAAQVGVEKNFSWNDYKFNPSKDGATFTKYSNKDEKILLDVEDDVAANIWGSDWRIPSASELQILSQAVNTTWTDNYQDSGVAGLILTDKEDESITLFLPITGMCNDDFVIDDDIAGFYWTKSLGNTENKGLGLGFDKTNGVIWDWSGFRSVGYAIRPVLEGPAKRTIMGVTQAEKDIWNSKYSKSENGIPKTDLESNVQNSLENANTALQATVDILEQLEELKAKVDAQVEHTFEYHLTNVSSNSGNATSMKKADTVTLRFSAAIGYLMPDSVTVYGATFTYNKSNSSITVFNPTKDKISITINATDKRQCTFNNPSLTYFDFSIISGEKTQYVIEDTFTGKISLKSTVDTELWGMPTSVSGSNCTISNYNSSTGEFTIRCNGSGNMTISASPRDVAIYRFAVALETNPIFTVSEGTITGMNVANIGTLEGAMSATGSCPINFDSGFTAPSSVDVEGAYVWFIIPQKHFNVSNFNFINGSNRYLLKQSNIQDLTINTKIKDCVNITTGKIPYTLVCVSNNGLGGKQEFKKL